MTAPTGSALAPPVDGQVCALIAVDIAEFTRPDRDDDVRMFMREELYRILERAFDKSGIPWTACLREAAVMACWSSSRLASPLQASSTRCPSGSAA